MSDFIGSAADSCITNDTSPNFSLSKPAKLDGLFHHLSASTGLYSKETFLSLFGSISRMIRDHRLRGFALARASGDEDFETLAYALANLPEMPFHTIGMLPENGLSEPFMTDINGADEDHCDFYLPTSSGLPRSTGFLLVLTDRLCAAMYWSPESCETFRLYQGGWTFHPEDVRTLAVHLTHHVIPTQETYSSTALDSGILLRLLEETALDRRYDKRLNILISSLVNSLEGRNRELSLALGKVSVLNHKMLEQERLAAIGQLCSVIAHEIRNPLGLIDLYAKLVEDQLSREALTETEINDKKPNRQQLLKNLSLIRQSIGSLETILSELTNYSRPLTLNWESVDLSALVHDICTFYQPLCQERQLHLQVLEAHPHAFLEMKLDCGRIRQALINLVKNAVEASSAEDTVTVSIASRKGDENLYIKVKDQGAGIDSKSAQKLFTPYFSTKAQGTGLGLAHSRKILQAHGGSVELLASTPGQGSTFALVLPKSLLVDSTAIEET